MILSLLLGASISGERAVALAKEALADFDVAGPLRLQSLGGAYQIQTANGLRLSGDRARWHLKLGSPAFAYGVALADDGRLLYAERTDFSGSHSAKPQKDDATKAARWLARFHPRLSTRLLPSGTFGGSTFFYEGLVGGYPVVYPRTRLGYMIALENGNLFHFRAEEEPPPLGPTTPRLTEADALAAVDRIFKRDVVPAGAKRGWRMFYRLEGRRELGWVVPDGGGGARLAWHVPFGEYRDIPNWAIQGGSSGMLIDAITGERTPTKTVP